MISNDIYASAQQIENFKPTYLYIKRHTITGLLYLGKTVKMGYKFEHYNGSGKYWTNHIKKYGTEFVETVWFCLFTDIHELTKFSTIISENYDIVASDLWANQIPEIGLGGGIRDHHLYKDSEGNTKFLSSKDPRVLSKEFISFQTGSKHSIERRQNNSKSQKGRKHSQETKELMSKKRTGLKRPNAKSSKGIPNLKLKQDYHLHFPTIECPYCGMSGRGGTMKRWHFDNCKLNTHSLCV